MRDPIQSLCRSYQSKSARSDPELLQVICLTIPLTGYSFFTPISNGRQSDYVTQLCPCDCTDSIRSHKGSLYRIILCTRCGQRLFVKLSVYPRDSLCSLVPLSQRAPTCVSVPPESTHSAHEDLHIITPNRAGAAVWELDLDLEVPAQPQNFLG